MREERCNIDQIEHPAVRECLKFMRIEQGIEMVHTSDLPARSGIGSSSAFTVGFLNALYALSGRMVGKRRLASNAIIYVEQNIVGESVGPQDQVAAAFGRLNRIEFNGKENLFVQPVTLNRRRIMELQNYLMFFFTGCSRTASKIASEQIQNTAAKSTELRTLRDMVDEAVNILNNSDENIEGFGKLLDESWKLKRSLSKRVSTSTIEDMYEVALKAGAVGGKLSGAGGGGFML